MLPGILPEMLLEMLSRLLSCMFPGMFLRTLSGMLSEKVSGKISGKVSGKPFHKKRRNERGKLKRHDFSRQRKKPHADQSEVKSRRTTYCGYVCNIVLYIV